MNFVKICPFQPTEKTLHFDDSQLEIINKASISPDFPMIVPEERKRFSLSSGLLAIYNSSLIQLYHFDGRNYRIVEDDISFVLVLALYMPNSTKYESSIKHCIAVGTLNGYLKLYDETAQMFHSQQYHDSSILSIKSQPSNSIEQEDELVLLYSDNVIVTVDSAGLWMMLKMQDTTQFEFEPPPLVYKKSIFKSNQVIIDIGVVGDLDFDAMVPRFDIFKGFIKVPFGNIYLAVGHPFLSLYKQGNRISLRESVATKVNALGGAVLSFAKSMWGNQQTNVSNIEQDKLEKYFELIRMDDGNRQTTKIMMSPKMRGISRYAIMNDTLGRVMLYEVFTGIIIKMWKGLRNPQYGWIDSNTVLFLALLNKGVLEVFTLPECHKVYSTKCSPQSNLVQSEWDLIAGNHANTYKLTAQCYLVEDWIFKLEPLPELVELAKPLQFDKLYQLVQEYKNSKKQEQLREIFETISKFEYLSVKLKSLEYLDETIPIEFYQNLLESIALESETLNTKLHFVKHYIRIQNILKSAPDIKSIDSPINLKIRYKTITGNNTDIEYTKYKTITGNNTDIEYTKFVNSFSRQSEHLYCLALELTSKQLSVLSKYLIFPIINLGYSHYEIFDKMQLLPNDILVLFIRYLDLIQGNVSEQMVKNIKLFVNDQQWTLSILVDYAYKCESPVIAYILSVALYELRGEEKFKQNVDLIENQILPLYYFLNETLQVSIMKFNKTERFSVEYFIANNLDKKLNNGDYSLLESAKPFVDTLDGIILLLIFNAISRFDNKKSKGEIQTIDSLINQLVDESCKYVAAVSFVNIILVPLVNERDSLFLSFSKSIASKLISEYKGIEHVKSLFSCNNLDGFDGIFGELLPFFTQHRNHVIDFEIEFCKFLNALDITTIENVSLMFSNEFYKEFGINLQGSNTLEE